MGLSLGVRVQLLGFQGVDVTMRMVLKLVRMRPPMMLEGAESGVNVVLPGFEEFFVGIISVFCTTNKHLKSTRPCRELGR